MAYIPILRKPSAGAKPPARVVPAKTSAPTTKKLAAGKEIQGNFITTLSIEGYRPHLSCADPKGSTGRLIIGLDPSVTHFGYVELTESMEILHPDTVIPKKLTGMPRMRYLMEEVVEKRILARKHLWDVVVFREDYAYAAHSSSDSILKELGGILEYELYKHGIKLLDIPLTSAKKMAAGKGNANKDEIIQAVHQNFGFKGDEHSCDALAVAVTGVCLLNRGKITGLTKAQAEVLESLKDHDLTPKY